MASTCDVQMNSSSSSAPIPLRKLHRLYASRTTIRCAIGPEFDHCDRGIACDSGRRRLRQCPQSSRDVGKAANACIPCAYKIGCFDVSLDIEFTKTIPNQRPDQCPRFSAFKPVKSKTGVDSRCVAADLRSYGFRRGMNILCVGDGDLSFSLSLSRALLHEEDSERDCKTRIVATSYESLSTLQSVYPADSITATVEELRALGATVLFEVDSTHLADSLNEAFCSDCRNRDTYLELPETYHRIIWNFPCTAEASGKDGQNEQMDENKNLVRQFAVGGSELLDREAGEIHLAHKTKPPFDQWKLENVVVEFWSEHAKRPCVQDKRLSGNSGGQGECNGAESEALMQNLHDEEDGRKKVLSSEKAVERQQSGADRKMKEGCCSVSLEYKGRIVFDRCCFPPYTPRKALNPKSFTCHDACVYIFGLKGGDGDGDSDSDGFIARDRVGACSGAFPPTIPFHGYHHTDSAAEIFEVTEDVIKRIRDIHLMHARNSTRMNKKRRFNRKTRKAYWRINTNNVT